MKIVPAILAENYDDFVLRVRQAETFTQYVQIDCMDGIFVPAKSVPPETIGSLSTSLSFELHLMVRDPSSFVDKAENEKLERVLFHFEADVDHLGFMKLLKDRGVSPGLAVRPETPMEDFLELVSHADTLLFLTVSPGRYGSDFRPEVLEKVAEARRRFPGKLIAVDGGVSLDNLGSFVDIGVDYVCVGSRIFLGGEPAENYRSFTEKLKGLGEYQGGR
jgi:ribulose-phosphate 3-epimerase